MTERRFRPRPCRPNGVAASTTEKTTRAAINEPHSADAQSDWRVVDDWPAGVPVTRDEIDVLETYLGALLDEILGGARASE